jgi:hypothetical protein
MKGVTVCRSSIRMVVIKVEIAKKDGSDCEITEKARLIRVKLDHL